MKRAFLLILALLLALPALGQKMQPGEDPARFVMHRFAQLPSAYPEIATLAPDSKNKGVWITLKETPEAGPYHIKDANPEEPLELYYTAFGVKNGVLTLAWALFENGYDLIWYDDTTVELPVIPLNFVTKYAAQFEGVEASDGGLYFGRRNNEGDAYGFQLRKDDSFKFGDIYGYCFSADSQYKREYFDLWNEESNRDRWRIPISMSFWEFYFAYDLSEFIADPEKDTDLIWNKARSIYLKNCTPFQFGEVFPMTAEGYDAAHKGLKMVFLHDVCPPIYIPMTAAQATALLKTVKQKGTDNLVWYYVRDLDEGGDLYVKEAGVGYSIDRMYKYVAE